jgi:hypothetical protein
MTAIPTRIRAVRENPEKPLLDCYTSNPNGLAALLASRTTAEPHRPQLKENMNMSHHNYTGYSSLAASKSGTTKQAVAGVGASTDPARLIDVLARLGLCPHDLATPLKQLAAGGTPVKDFYQVSVWDLDRALANVDCSVSQRMAFKNSLDLAGLLSVPK